MIVLTRPGGAVGLFGLGLLGSAVRAAVRRRYDWQERELPFPWTPGAEQDAAAGVIEGELTADDVRVVWCAGQAGFGASDEQVNGELAGFRTVLNLAERLSAERIGFHLLSSAGGLFEGQTDVGPDTPPDPRRPYARLKLQQDQLLAAAHPRLVKRAYRVSSVYGLPRGKQRLGLIPTLVGNGLRHRVTTLVGRATTQRDFVWAADVGRFVAADLSADAGCAIHLLASGRPTTLWEVQHAIEAALGRRLYVTYAGDPSNAADMSFSPRALPAGWEPTDLAVGVRQVCQDALGRVG